jgi:hypothetical protein
MLAGPELTHPILMSIILQHYKQLDALKKSVDKK